MYILFFVQVLLHVRLITFAFRTDSSSSWNLKLERCSTCKSTNLKEKKTVEEAPLFESPLMQWFQVVQVQTDQITLNVQWTGWNRMSWWKEKGRQKDGDREKLKCCIQVIRSYLITCIAFLLPLKWFAAIYFIHLNPIYCVTGPE